MRQRIKKSGLFAIVMLFILFLSCSKDSGTEPEKNSAPDIFDLSVDKSSLDYGDTAILTARAADPDGDFLYFSWESSGGALTLNKTLKADTVQNMMTWKAPDTSGTYICTVTVTDSINDPVNKSISLNVSAHPILDLSMSQLDFGSDTDTLTFMVTNQGTGELKWSISLEPPTAMDWLSYTPIQGTTISSAYSYITVIAKRSGLSGGSYQAWMKVTSEKNGSDSVLVFLKQPQLSVSPVSLDFGSETSLLTFGIQNSGSGEMVWTIDDSGLPVWIDSVSPTSGSTTTETDQVSVSVIRDKLNSGSYNAQIPVNSSSGSNELVNVMMTVKDPELSVTPSNLDFGTEDTEKTLKITNVGAGQLKWQCSESIAWITSIDPDTGSTYAETDQIVITADRTGLSPGTYTGEIHIEAIGKGGQKSVNVSIEVLGPELSLSPVSLDFQTDLTTLSFNISNTGENTLNWSVDNSGLQSWITSVSPLSGTTTSETDQVSITIDRAGLTPGTYTDQIQVTSDGGNGSVDIQMEVVAPVLSISPISLDFQTDLTTLSFNISNTGGGTLNWTVDNSGLQSWITSVSPLSGTTTSETDQVSVIIDRTGLTAGTYTDQIQVTSDGGNGSVDIQMEVGAPVLSISPLSLDFQEDLTTLSFDISNTGSGTLSWTVDNSGLQSWITSVSPLSGTTTTETDPVTVMVSRTGLAIGDYTDQIPVNSDGGNDQVNVSLSVPQPPPTCIFYDDFSGPLSSDWTTSYSTAYTSGGYLYMSPTSSTYYGTVYHSFTTYIDIPWTCITDVGYSSGTPTSSDYYGSYMKISDTGTISMPYLWFAIWPNSSSQNWGVLAFLSAGTQSQWAWLASDSKGTSSLINTAKNGMNEIHFCIESDEEVGVKIGSSTLYTTDEIKAIEGVIGDVGTDLSRVGIRATHPLTAKSDYICVSESGCTTFLSSGKSSKTTKVFQEKELDEIVKLLPADISKLRTVQEVLRDIRR